MKIDKLKSSEDFAQFSTERKCSSKQQHWLRASPYLFLSWFAAGVTLPLIVTLLAATQFNTAIITVTAKQTALFSLNDIIQTQKLSQSKLYLNGWSALSNNTRIFKLSATRSLHKTYINETKHLSELMSITLNTHSTSCTNTAFYSSSVFSAHPHLDLFSILTWIAIALHIRAEPIC
ncbi:hypothetical protein [Thorsellia anophelis]|uniref:Uncharacterized protein n=1 Tax=Thorsellia anophelis DSM 18579 TaxID=1123402 RepID=A0A1I0DY43_9GAMM|nr:hypothetical protein [Thorsellia anophelis]SET37624.1 hypothetical protein SAMN02583745_02174 [Thorsellia anophelis DSM 18579]